MTPPRARATAGTPEQPVSIRLGRVDAGSVVFRMAHLLPDRTYGGVLRAAAGDAVGVIELAGTEAEADLDIHDLLVDQASGPYLFEIRHQPAGTEPAPASYDETDPATWVLDTQLAFQYVAAADAVEEPPATTVRLTRTATEPTGDEVLTRMVLAGSRQRQFEFYDAYVRARFGSRERVLAPNAYDRLVDITREFLAQARWSEVIDPTDRYFKNGVLPYVANVAERYADVVDNRDVLSALDPQILDEPLPVELIWSYWQEEGGLVQSLNLILARFQNRRVGPGPNPLARFDLHPLRPLRHLLWTFAEEEVSRLTVRRRAAEYEFEYGLDLIGRAVPGRGLYVERRNRFLESFHALLHEAHKFFHRDDDTTVVADPFPVLNALRDTHLVMAEGAENQFGDLPTEARVQMLVMQEILAQPEMRDFLGGRPMMPYEEPWMDRVDTMKNLFGWSPTSITHFHELAVYGEQLLLTIRWGNWNDTSLDAASAANWARALRPQIQRYVHAYRAVTGVDLSETVDATMPALLLARRLQPARRA
ncbi:hypothetical protein [Georgenia sp. SYP-B2076]|uniref:hypothetical protein n=1 Tax=Georgenia sp. SYP-B2076 TaxID=2495881 RepID=UPI000F8D8B9A|nr:hypothetical protein [Georgenia sp. SYP-B2076]